MSNANEPAFPRPHGALCVGLTKREHYAGLAMQGILASADFAVRQGGPTEIAAWATECADALLARLGRPP